MNIDEIKAFCKDGKVMRVFLGNKDIISNEDRKILRKEGVFRCRDLEYLLKESLNGNEVDFSKYLDLDMIQVTDFEKKVYIETMNIPKGQVKTYKQIGEAIGSRGYRAVGNALNKNPIAIIIPCHRVIGSNMKLTGFRGGLDMKKEMLNNEGIKIKKENVIN